MNLFQLVEQLIVVYQRWEDNRSLEKIKAGAKSVSVFGSLLGGAASVVASFVETHKTPYLRELVRTHKMDDASQLARDIKTLHDASKAGAGEFKKLLSILLEYNRFLVDPTNAQSVLNNISSTPVDAHFSNFITELTEPLRKAVEEEKVILARKEDAPRAAVPPPVPAMSADEKKKLVDQAAQAAAFSSGVAVRVVVSSRDINATPNSAPALQNPSLPRAVASRGASVPKIESVKTEVFDAIAAKKREEALQKELELLKEQFKKEKEELKKAEQRNRELEEKKSQQDVLLRRKEDAADKRIQEANAAYKKELAKKDELLRVEQQKNATLDAENKKFSEEIERLESVLEKFNQYYLLDPTVDGWPMLTWRDDQKNLHKMADLLYVSKIRYKFFYDKAKKSIAESKKEVMQKIAEYEKMTTDNIAKFAEPLKEKLCEVKSKADLFKSIERSAKELYASQVALLDRTTPKLDEKTKAREMEKLSKSCDDMLQKPKEEHLKSVEVMRQHIMRHIGNYINQASNTDKTVTAMAKRLLEKDIDEVTVIVDELQVQQRQRDPLLSRYRGEVESINGDEAEIDELFQRYQYVYEGIIFGDMDEKVLKDPSSPRKFLYPNEPELKKRYMESTLSRTTGSGQKLADLLPTMANGGDLIRSEAYKKDIAVFKNESSARMLTFDRKEDSLYDFIAQYREFAKRNRAKLAKLGEVLARSLIVRPGDFPSRGAAKQGMFGEVTAKKDDHQTRVVEVPAGATVSAAPAQAANVSSHRV
jgi:hypothetical protein